MLKRIVISSMALLGILLLLHPYEIAADSALHQGQQDGLLSNTIHALCPFEEEMLVGTSSGLNIWDGQNWASVTNCHGLPQGRITALASNTQSIAAGSWGDGLSIWDGATWTHYARDNTPGLGSAITGLAYTEDMLWAATYGHGVACLSGDEWRFYDQGDAAPANSFVQAIYADATGSIWIGTSSGIVQTLHSESWTTAANLPAHTSIHSLLAVRDTLWIGSSAGLWHLSLGTGELDLLDGTDALAIQTLELHRDELVVGALNGLFRLENGALKQISGASHTAIGALAVDSNDNLWIGQLSGGIDVLGDSDFPKPSVCPTLLIHGWRGPDSDLLSDSEFWFLADWLKKDGITPVYVQGVSPKNTIFENAAIIDQVVAQTLSETESDQVNIIAFSMGGLNARAALSLLEDPDQIHQIITLGSPHQGEILWFPFLMWEYLFWTHEPSALELFPEHMAVINETLGTRSVPLTVIAGDAREIENLPMLFADLAPSDGLVSTWSALGPGTLPSSAFVTTDIHAWGRDTILLGLSTLLLPESTYQSIIRPVLFEQSTRLATTPPVATELLEQPEPFARTAFTEATVLPGETVTLTIPLDSAPTTRILARSEGPLPRVTLVSPTGEVIDSDVAEDRDDIEYLGFDQADLRSYVITNTLTGPWLVVLQAETDASSTADCVVYAENTSDISLEIVSDKNWYTVGESAQITASVQGTGSALQSVSMIVFDPEKNATSAEMVIEGQNASGSVKLDAPGYYVLLVTGRAFDGALTIERQESLVIGAMSPLELLQEPTYVESEGYPALRLDVASEIGGEYLFCATTADGQSAFITTLLDSGDNTVRLPVPWLDAHTGYDRITVLDLANVATPALRIPQRDNE